jgi:diacylglycerol kinase
MKPISFSKYLMGRGKSFKNAYQGLWYVIRTQKNAQIHLLATCIVLLAGFYFKLSIIDNSIILLCIGVVWVTEIINTAIEALVDLCSPNYHPLAKISKDVSAAAVLVSAFTAAIIGIIVFLPHLLK